MSTPAQTTITALKAAAPDVANLPQVRVGFTNLQSFELAQRAAKCLAASTLVPQRYQGNIPNCVIALNMASRIGADPLMVMQNLYVVHGNPGWSSKFLIACFNECGRFSSVKYRMVGTRGKDDWGCVSWAKELATGDVVEGPLITIELAKKEGWYQKSGSKWQTMPEQMLRYRAAAWMINTTAPEIAMGIRTAEEIDDAFDATIGEDGKYSVSLESLRQAEGAATADIGTPATQPEWTEQSALVAIAAAKTLGELEITWKSIDGDCGKHGVDPWLPVEAAYQDRKAALEQKL